MRKPRQPKIYATLRRRYTRQALLGMKFVRDGSRMVRFGACRSELATATSLDGEWWRVTPLVRHWR
jgi:hypothetical protein